MMIWRLDHEAVFLIRALTVFATTCRSLLFINLMLLPLSKTC